MLPRRSFLSIVWLVLASWHPASAQSHPTSFPELTPEQEAAYGNRAAFFRSIPPESRPDVDWRAALSESLANVEPQWSQGLEELVIRDFFADREGGFYVDVGCHLPRRGSTTYDLEQRLNWTGIGIDVMARYREPWKRMRPDSKFIEAAVADTNGETVRLHVAGPYASLDEETIDSLWKADEATVIEVETATLDTLLEQQDIQRIDFLSMDIEGAELAALKGFDIKRFKPKLCCIETAKRDAVTEYFESNGYELIEKYLEVDKINLYFRPKAQE